MAILNLRNFTLERITREELANEIHYKTLQAKRDFITLRQNNGNLSTSIDKQLKENFKQVRHNAHTRNLALLKELDTESAKLRSRTCYCPTELQLAKLKKKYEEEIRRNK